jgi:hypothetical protein
LFPKSNIIHPQTQTQIHLFQKSLQ